MDGYDTGGPLVGAEPVCLVMAKPGPGSMTAMHWSPGTLLFQRLFCTTYAPATGVESNWQQRSACAGVAAPIATRSAAPPMAQTSRSSPVITGAFLEG